MAEWYEERELALFSGGEFKFKMPLLVKARKG